MVTNECLLATFEGLVYFFKCVGLVKSIKDIHFYIYPFISLFYYNCIAFYVNYSHKKGNNSGGTMHLIIPSLPKFEFKRLLLRSQH